MSTDDEKYLQRPTASVLKEACIEYIRSAALATLVVWLLTPAWQQLNASWPYSDRLLFVLVTSVIHEVLYYSWHWGMQACEARGWLQRYKIPRTKGQVPSAELVGRTLREACVGHFLLQPLTLYAVYPWVVSEQGVPGLPSGTPLSTLCAHFACIMFINDLLFFLGHSLLHENKWLYAHVHKQHHQYSGSIGIAAEYAHPLEALLGNQLPMLLPVLLFNLHLCSWTVFVFWRLWRTYEGHSGYSFAGTWPSRLGLLHGYSALYHDFHHSANVGNYTGPGHGLFDHLTTLATGRPMQAAWLKHCTATSFQPEQHARWLA